MFRRTLPFLIPAMGLLYIFLIPDDPEPIKLLFKLIPMVLILCYACLHAPAGELRSHKRLLLGLLFCMIGDATLRWFVIGLSAFLIGHLFYLSYFLRQRRMTRAKLIVMLPMLVYAVYIAARLVQGLLDSNDGYLIAPVLFYVAAIFTMSVSALANGNRFAIAGSLLFLASDSILSWNMFVSDVRFSGPLIMLTYYAAQWLIASSIKTPLAKPQASERQNPSFG
ncbi:lysoplasmalogenase [Cohnella sp. AR92]|uniref:lysoplasmalogenase n=1 Tax=Cohnella sp. AR92 TaxID=648716 RepID=UPI000F8CC4C5|nr:lysoplasmalogenase [Cohnella sp. AR92]RUS49009.1 lysoplasmalogenase [Cohnella sp. AR92]